MDRQKVLLIFGGAWVSAALLTWLLYSATIAPKTDKTVKAVAAARDMPAGTRLKKGDLKEVRVAEKDLPRSAVVDDKAIVERVLLFPVSSNEVITSSRLASTSGAEGLPATIDPGKRAISVAFTDATGVAGLIQPRSHVDVLFTRPGSLAEAVTTTVIEDVVVLAIGRNTEVIPAPATPAGAAAPAANISTTTQRAATLLVTPEQARKLEWAKNQGKISLTLRNPLDKALIADTEPTTAFDLNLASSRPRRNVNVGNNRSWAQLTGQGVDEMPRKPAVMEKPKPPEPPKPRFTVDVYRGDKHVQEIFQ